MSAFPTFVLACAPHGTTPHENYPDELAILREEQKIIDAVQERLAAALHAALKTYEPEQFADLLNLEYEECDTDPLLVALEQSPEVTDEFADIYKHRVQRVSEQVIELITDDTDASITFAPRAASATPGIPLLVTGGMSWGDGPTDSYPIIDALAMLGLFDEAID